MCDTQPHSSLLLCRSLGLSQLWHQDSASSFLTMYQSCGGSRDGGRCHQNTGVYVPTLALIQGNPGGKFSLDDEPLSFQTGQQKITWNICCVYLLCVLHSPCLIYLYQALPAKCSSNQAAMAGWMSWPGFRQEIQSVMVPSANPFPCYYPTYPVKLSIRKLSNLLYHVYSKSFIPRNGKEKPWYCTGDPRCYTARFPSSLQSVPHHRPKWNT